RRTARARRRSSSTRAKPGRRSLGAHLPAATTRKDPASSPTCPPATTRSQPRSPSSRPRPRPDGDLMANVAYIATKERLPSPGLAESLGQASVTAVEGPDVVVELPDGAEARVALAFTFPYAPAPGDVLLVIGKDGTHYAIGVLHGAGKTTLTFPG